MGFHDCLCRLRISGRNRPERIQPIPQVEVFFGSRLKIRLSAVILGIVANRIEQAEKLNRTALWCWSLRFYKEGRKIKEYQVADLVEIPNARFLPYTTCGWHSVWYESAQYTNSQFILTTAPQFLGRVCLFGGNVFSFDANTGELVRERRHHPVVALGLGMVGLLIVVLLGGTLALWAPRRRLP